MLRYNILKVKSGIDYEYLTIRLTRSRINYGLLAIPKDLLFLFPTVSTDLWIKFDGYHSVNKKSFVISEKNKEARIYGLSNWYIKNNLKENDEIVIFIDNFEKKVYKFFTEQKFIEITNKLQSRYEKSHDLSEAQENLILLTELQKLSENDVATRELLRVSNSDMHLRKFKIRENIRTKESVPPYLRNLFELVYKGDCQICSFGFLKKNQKPYYEIHHLNSEIGNHPKNLVVVCANCHRQFEYANNQKVFDSNGWLKQVYFNNKLHDVYQYVYNIKGVEFYKTIFY